MVPEDPCSELDEYEKRIVMFCMIGAVAGVLGSIVSVSHWNPVGLLCLGVSYKLYLTAKEVKEAARPPKE